MSTEEPTFWNFEPTTCVRGTAEVVDDLTFPQYWARNLTGERIPVVKVIYSTVFYLDNRDGSGWYKVTEGLGGPRVGHRNVQAKAFEAAS